ncbi:MAG: histidine phosphotransferase family protein [Pseudomonadota bacterium]|nr:histidine phosphotransferase family protein [Pseudomonadota bacterium]
MSTIDLHVLELLCSRICHDLIGPVSAVGNGIELMEEEGEDMAGDAIALIAHSAQQASRKLAMFRLAYGTGGNSSSVPLDQLAPVASGFFEGGKTQLSWFEGGLSSLDARGAVRLLACMLLLAEEVLVYGGTVTLSETGEGFSVLMEGRAAGLKSETRAALEGQADPSALTPRTAHAFVTGRFLEDAGWALTLHTSQEDRLEMLIQAAAPGPD